MIKTVRKRKLSVEKSASSVKTGAEPKKRQKIVKEATTTAAIQVANTGRKTLPLTKTKPASSVKTGTEPKKRQPIAKKPTATTTVQDANTRRKALPLTKGKSASSVKTGTEPKKRQQMAKTGAKTVTSQGASTSSKALPLTKIRSASSVVPVHPAIQKKEQNIPQKDASSVIVQDTSSRAEALPSRHAPIEFKCSICFDTTCYNKMKRLPCSHEFHEICVNEWLRRNTSCPYCRKPLAPPPRVVNQENVAQRYEQLQIEILMRGNVGRNLR